MKKFAALLLTLVMVLSLAACGSKTETPAKEEAPAQAETQEPAAEAGFTTVEDGKLHMSTNAAFPPYEMTNDAGEYEGIDVEIAQEIGRAHV